MKKQTPKKILFIITKGNFGGAQKYVYDLATKLPKEFFEPVVACGEGDILINKLKELSIKTVKIVELEREIGLKKDWRALRQILTIIETEQPNIVHLNSSKIGLLGAIAVLYLRLKSLVSDIGFSIPRTIFTAHGWAFNEKNRSFWQKLIFYISHISTVLICNKTIAVSQKTKKDISFLNFLRNKVEVIYNGLAPFDLLPKETARKEFTEDQSKTIIFSLTELNPNKGIDIALKGLALIDPETRKNICYYIAGDGEQNEELKKMAFDLGVNDIVNFLGFMSDGRKLLAGVDIFLQPSRTENLPFAILEAGFAELPIISTSVGGIPEIIKDMKNGILVHPKPKEISEAINYLLEHQDKKIEFGKEIKKTIKSFFTLDKMMSETVKLYNELE